MDFYPIFAGVCSSNELRLLTQGDLHNIICHFNLSKKQSELLGSMLKDLLHQNTKMCFYCGHHEQFKDFLSQENGVMFWKDVCLVMEVLGHEYNPN